MTPAELQKMLRALQAKDKTVRMTLVNGKKAIVSANHTLYEF